ncbi:hypothetical protein [Streptococcus pluranimalium]|uniref:hypothetical protein n=1 Tax=Streptococcus pluranimalium TaxID=82348 RepID=UPI0039FBD2C3
MQNLDLILSIIASIISIFSAFTSYQTKQEIKKLMKNSNISQMVGNHNSGITQTQNIGDNR